MTDAVLTYLNKQINDHKQFGKTGKAGVSMVDLKRRLVSGISFLHDAGFDVRCKVKSQFADGNAKTKKPLPYLDWRETQRRLITGRLPVGDVEKVEL